MPLFLKNVPKLLARPLCRNVSGILTYTFWRTLPGVLLEDFSGTFPHKHEEKKSGDRIREKKSGESKIKKIRETNPFCQKPTLKISRQNKSQFRNCIVMAFPRKNSVFVQVSSLPPMPTPSRTKTLCLLSSLLKYASTKRSDHLKTHSF